MLIFASVFFFMMVVIHLFIGVVVAKRGSDGGCGTTVRHVDCEVILAAEGESRCSTMYQVS